MQKSCYLLNNDPLPAVLKILETLTGNISCIISLGAFQNFQNNSFSEHLLENVWIDFLVILLLA